MSAYREIISANLMTIKSRLNKVLSGEELDAIKPILRRIDSTGDLPSWFAQLASDKTFPNLDGKTIGSIVEKLLACVIEKYVLKLSIQLHINPAKGVDIPELELGVKSPSENFCTSEPYFSAYERLVGNVNDALVLLTDYQKTKRMTAANHGLRLQIKDLRYLRGSEIADRNLCLLAEALKHEFVAVRNDEYMFKRAIHFLAYVNQSDWEAARILELLQNVVVDNNPADDEIRRIQRDYAKKNERYAAKNKPLIPEEMLRRVEQAVETPDGIVLCAENWVTRTLNENWHSPSASVWHHILNRTLEGKIGMSFALQWRYNFSAIFKRRLEH